MRAAILGFALVWLALAALPADAACGDDPAPCTVPLGTYHARLPTGQIRGAVVFLHGAGGNGAAALTPSDWTDTALKRGYALIAPDGLTRPGGRSSGWSILAHRPKARDEIAFLTSVRDDAAARFDLDPETMILAGFSVGGSMASYVACEAPASFAAYAPVAGGFWRPHPTACSGPVRLLHTHGWTDTTVPLEGRVLRGADSTDPQALMQGDIFYTLEMWRGVNACLQLRADRFVTEGAFLRRVWDRCLPDTALEFALHAGGHEVPKGWGRMMLDWAEGL